MMKSMKDLKPFTKEWWTNYWFYYRWHTIAGLFALVLIVGTAVDMLTKVKPDISLCFAGEFLLSDEESSLLTERVKQAVTDINGDGEVNVEFLEMVMNAGQAQDEMQMANQQKLYLQFAAGDSYLFVLDRDLFEVYDEQNLFDKSGICVETKDCALFEGTQLLQRDAVLVTRWKRQDKDFDYTTTQQLIDTYKKAEGEN